MSIERILQLVLAVWDSAAFVRTVGTAVSEFDAIVRFGGPPILVNLHKVLKGCNLIIKSLLVVRRKVIAWTNKDLGVEKEIVASLEGKLLEKDVVGVII